MTDEELLARLLYRDGMMLVIDKPAGIAVHRGPKGRENLEDYFDALRFGLPRDPALAHRLDHERSECLVLGRRGKPGIGPSDWLDLPFLARPSAGCY
jgi:tRNA pseudouridine32 synthase/23S rRNA pseudouridine746 synthase